MVVKKRGLNEDERNDNEYDQSKKMKIVDTISKEQIGTATATATTTTKSVTNAVSFVNQNEPVEGENEEDDYEDEDEEDISLNKEELSGNLGGLDEGEGGGKEEDEEEEDEDEEDVAIDSESYRESSASVPATSVDKVTLTNARTPSVPESPRSSSSKQKIPISFIENKSRRHVTFAKRRHGIMKKAYELSVLTGANVLLLILSSSGLVYTFTTPKLEPVIRDDEGKNLIRKCLGAPDNWEYDEGTRANPES
ncbi:Arg80p NDAI_0B01290 [Naumovozyma dairenensis CBS 421]|uniref:MADS-box domain-containing protein n=1 Tax=Naumovozyma dairenensis (strain ATCC 10597 / BCRC 20456 / CBS 421 / NBRC 0211 / NRRL Y-12639) TaxID=1071378 RepID=G0W5V2_NAUDC|nr:hypothetical protein NDAI_0B01290 [Naumovozyma dairenensis CBS 421]CCD23163.1 hypothetical protein NDAI_0B01290 [Naumovozyma dairenensis CBS 421]